MTATRPDTQVRAALLAMQRDEATSQQTYLRLANVIRDAHNAAVLREIAAEEERHYAELKALTGREVAPRRAKIALFTFLARLFGLTFVLKLMERGEEGAQVAYATQSSRVPQLEAIMADEHDHEEELLNMLDEEALRYAGSVVLGLNDALVELTGALAGYSLAFQNTHTIALTGLITGISASLSMSASEFLSVRAEGGERSPGRSALYTGIAYVITVALLVLPYLVLSHYLVCLGMTLLVAVGIIALFNYYLSVVQGFAYRRRFAEMAVISLGVAALSFGIGYVVRMVFGVGE